MRQIWLRVLALLRPAPLARWLVAVATISLLCGSSGWAIYDARQSALRQALQQGSNITLAIQSEIARTINTLDVSIRSAVQEMAIPGLETMDPAVRQAILFAGGAAEDGSVGLFIHDETGRLIHESGRLRPQALNVFDHPYFQAHRAQADLGLVISPPVHAYADGKWIIVLSRRINHPDGSFAGVVARPLSVSFFRTLFDGLDIGRNGIINLLTDNGLLVARRPFQEQIIGRDMSKTLLFDHLRDASTGAFEATGTIDHVGRLYSYRRVDSLPLVISVDLPVREITAAWRQHSLILVSVLLFVVSVVAWAAIEVWRELRQQSCARADAERQKGEVAAQLRTVFAQSNDMMLVVRVTPGGEFCYELVNPVWEEMFGVSAERATGRSPHACPPSQHADAMMAAMQQCRDQAAPVRLAFTTQQPEKIRSWEGLIAPVFGQGGRVGAMIAMARNITERKLFEAGLRQSQRMEAVGQLTAGVAHDFNNMLQGILGALDLLHDQPDLDDEGRACVAVATDAAERGATLVHRLLAFSRKQPLDPVLLNPEQVVNDMAQLLCHTLGGQIRLETLIEGTPWPVCADVSQLQNCLFNLAINARDAMPSGGVIKLVVSNAAVEAATEAGLPAGEYTCFAVADEGQGMTPETLERALEPFFTTKPLGKGTGLGLPMVQGFARQSGGDLRIKTAPGEGTTMTIWLPRATPALEAERPPLLDMQDSSDHGRLRVLVVDDEAAVRQTLSLFLTKSGYAAITADDAHAALQLIRSDERVDLVIADQSMPGLTGSDLLGEISLLRPHVPAVLITGYDKVGGLGELQGRITVLRKPFTRATFLRQVQAIIGSSVFAPGLRVEPMGTRPANIVPLRAGPMSP